jgi:hypothetical protein
MNSKSQILPLKRVCFSDSGPSTLKHSNSCEEGAGGPLCIGVLPGKELLFELGTVAHACNPNYSGGTDQEDPSSKLAWANSLQDPILKKTHHKKKGWWSG